MLLELLEMFESACDFVAHLVELLDAALDR